MKEQRKRSMEQMRPVIKDWELSGQTKKDYCQQHGISIPVFYYWYKRYRQEDTAGGFIPVVLNGKPIDHIEVRYPNGVTIKLPANTSLATLRTYIYL
jgi:transposase-like protein